MENVFNYLKELEIHTIYSEDMVLSGEIVVDLFGYAEQETKLPVFKNKLNAEGKVENTDFELLGPGIVQEVLFDGKSKNAKLTVVIVSKPKEISDIEDMKCVNCTILDYESEKALILFFKNSDTKEEDEEEVEGDRK